MKKDKIDFHIELKDAFGEVVKERHEQGKDKVPVWVDRSLVTILSHPSSTPEGVTLDTNRIVERLLLQQKIATKEPKEFSSDEITVIREATACLFNKRFISVELAGTILNMTK